MSRFEYSPDADLEVGLVDERAAACSYWLIAALDSDRRPAASLSGTTLLETPEVSFIRGDGLWVSRATLSELVAGGGLFAGFDEIWGFAEDVRATVTNCPVSIATDLQDRAPTTDLQVWMATHRPLLGLGDGIGLNVVVP